MASRSKKPAQPAHVLRRFLDAASARDIDAMKACLTKKSVESGQFQSPPEGVRFEVGEPQAEGELVVIPVQAIPTAADAASRGTPPPMTLPCVMTREDGQWKLDFVQTMDRLFGGSVRQAVEQVASAMTQAVEGVGQALAQGLRGTFGESETEAAAPAQDWSAAPDEYAPQELYDLADMIALPKTAAAISAAVGSPVEAVVAMKEIMAKVGSDDFTLMTNWMDDQLFANYGNIFAAINEYLPLANRLRAMRIEAADWHDDRMVVLDGSDVVFRLHFPNSDGYYGDDWVAWALPGVLAALPETIDAGAAGKRLVPMKEEPIDLDVYRDRTVPRFMRRIEKALGKRVRLDMDFENWYDPATTLRAFTRWGLNRVHGGVARACLDDEQRKSLSENLHTIRVAIGTGPFERTVRYADGVLELVIDQHHGEAGGVYESDIAFVLGGGVLRPEGASEPASGTAASDEQQTESAETPRAKTKLKRKSTAKKAEKKSAKKPAKKKSPAKKRK